MGKEQDLLVAVKSGDLLLAHKLLSKVKCNKASEYRVVGWGIFGKPSLENGRKGLNILVIFVICQFEPCFYWSGRTGIVQVSKGKFFCY